ncbi:MAG: POTRA domain-containing protein, partial [Sandaracinobacteroides sp.]
MNFAALASVGSVASAQDTGSQAAEKRAIAAAAAPARDSFMIEAFDVAGNSILDELTVDRAISPFSGPDRTVQDIESARAALEAQYRKRGLDSVVVAAAEVPNEFAIVRIQVVETRVGTLKVVGSKSSSSRVVEQQLSELAPGTVPDFRAVERQITEANRHFASR